MTRPRFELGVELTRALEFLSDLASTSSDQERKQAALKAIEDVERALARNDAAAAAYFMWSATTFATESFELPRWRRQLAKIAKESADKAKGGKVSGEKRRNRDRDRRIHDRHEAGSSQKQIAIDEGLSESWVSRILDNPRP